MSTRERMLLGLAIVGFVVPNAMVTVFFAQHGVDLGAYFGHWGDSLPAAQLVADLCIAFVAFTLWAGWESQRLAIRYWWMVIPAALFVGVCFAVPLFLLMRERTRPESSSA